MRPVLRQPIGSWWFHCCLSAAREVFFPFWPLRARMGRIFFSRLNVSVSHFGRAFLDRQFQAFYFNLFLIEAKFLAQQPHSSFRPDELNDRKTNTFKRSELTRLLVKYLTELDPSFQPPPLLSPRPASAHHSRSSPWQGKAWLDRQVLNQTSCTSRCWLYPLGSCTLLAVALESRRCLIPFAEPASIETNSIRRDQ